MDRDGIVRGVTDTLLDFCTFCDEARLDEFVALFCEDGCFDPGRRFEGCARIRQLAAALLNSWSASSHHITNIRVEPTSDAEATSTCSIYAWHQRTDGTQYESWGRYIDRLRLDDGRWRFVERRVEMAGYRGIGDQGVRPVPRAAGPFA
jgi:3-phenylpropionate/cinnamic acid dioxygenase small subunit